MTNPQQQELRRRVAETMFDAPAKSGIPGMAIAAISVCAEVMVAAVIEGKLKTIDLDNGDAPYFAGWRDACAGIADAIRSLAGEG